MIEGPNRCELLGAVTAWLKDAASPAEGFHRKVAANALGIVTRELVQWPAGEAAAVARMRVILGREGDYASLNVALAEALREGTVEAGDAGVFDHLRRTALDILAIDQPRYRHELSAPTETKA